MNTPITKNSLFWLVIIFSWIMLFSNIFYHSSDPFKYHKKEFKWGETNKWLNKKHNLFYNSWLLENNCIFGH